jgi:hypothetical protein
MADGVNDPLHERILVAFNARPEPTQFQWPEGAQTDRPAAIGGGGCPKERGSFVFPEPTWSPCSEVLCVG